MPQLSRPIGRALHNNRLLFQLCDLFRATHLGYTLGGDLEQIARRVQDKRAEYFVLHFLGCPCELGINAPRRVFAPHAAPLAARAASFGKLAVLGELLRIEVAVANTKHPADVDAQGQLTTDAAAAPTKDDDVIYDPADDILPPPKPASDGTTRTSTTSLVVVKG